MVAAARRSNSPLRTEASSNRVAFAASPGPLELYELGLQRSGHRAEFIEPDGSTCSHDLVCKRPSLCDLPLAVGGVAKTRHLRGLTVYDTSASSLGIIWHPLLTDVVNF